MKKNQEVMIQDVIKGINWSKIRFFYQAFDIKWQFEEKDGYIIEKIPSISDLKDELRTLLKYVMLKDLPTLDYGNWVIYWHSEERARIENDSARLEAIFSVESSISIEEKGEQLQDIETLKNSLKKAIEEEKYEDAAKIRDKISGAEKKKNSNPE